LQDGLPEYLRLTEEGLELSYYESVVSPNSYGTHGRLDTADDELLLTPNRTPRVKHRIGVPYAYSAYLEIAGKASLVDDSATPRQATEVPDTNYARAAAVLMEAERRTAEALKNHNSFMMDDDSSAGGNDDNVFDEEMIVDHLNNTYSSFSTYGGAGGHASFSLSDRASAPHAPVPTAVPANNVAQLQSRPLRHRTAKAHIWLVRRGCVYIQC
jgi:hypothetical protein